jgi:hypothetical protein
MAGSIVFMAAYCFYVLVYLNEKIPVVYALFIAPLAIIMITSVYSLLLAGLNGKKFIREFLKLANLQAIFALLFLTPLLVKMNLPDPHNFLLRKLELMMGATYAVYVMILTGVFIREAVRSIDFAKLKEMQLFRYLAVLFFVFYFFISLWLNYANQPTGDEPAYLLMSHSIIYDRDLDLKNNFDNKDYLKFYNKNLQPQGTDIVRGTKIFSYHPVFFSVILAPFYFLGGRFGSVVFMNAAGASFIALLFLLLNGIIQDKKGSASAAALTGFTMPTIAFANNICTEYIIAVLVVLLYYLIKFKKEETLLISLLMAAIIWIHIRSLPIYAGLWLIFAYYKRKNIREIIKSAAIQFLSIAFFFTFNYFVLGSLLPSYSAGGGSNLQRFIPGNMFAGMLANFMDRQLGLFAYAPVFIFIVSGAIIMFLKHRKEFFEMIILFLPYFILITSWDDWGGGSSVSRYLMVVMFVFAACLAAVFKYLKNTAGLVLVRATAAISFFLSAVVIGVPWFRWDRPYGENGMMVMASKIIHFDLTMLFPSFKLGGNTVLLTLIWAAVIAAANYYIVSKNKFLFSGN